MASCVDKNTDAPRPLGKFAYIRVVISRSVVCEPPSHNITNQALSDIMRLVFLTLFFSLAYAIGARRDGDDQEMSTSVLPHEKEPWGGVQSTRSLRLNKHEMALLTEDEAQNYAELHDQGIDDVSNTKASSAMRNYRLRSKKRTGLLFKKDASLSSLIFPRVPANDYQPGDNIEIYTDVLDSIDSPIPFSFKDLSLACTQPEPSSPKRGPPIPDGSALGAELLGHTFGPSPVSLKVGENKGCTPICVIRMDRWGDKSGVHDAVHKNYRVQLLLDDLPVVVRESRRNRVTRGYPIGYTFSPTSAKRGIGGVYLNNHLRFTITYRKGEDYRIGDPRGDTEGLRILAFDVEPLSFRHKLGWDGDDAPHPDTTTPSGCVAPGASGVQRDPRTKLDIWTESKALLSYEVKWVSSDLPWSDRWDVYMLDTLQDDLYFIDTVNAFMMVLLITALIMIRVFRKRVEAGQNTNLQPLMRKALGEQNAWKELYGDVFRAPQYSPMLLSVMVGSGAHIGATFFSAILCFVLQLSPNNYTSKGSTFLTLALVVSAFSGAVAGYISARLYGCFDGKEPKRNAMYTTIAMPSALLIIFTMLNISLSKSHAATAISFLSLSRLYALWAIVFAPLSIWGSHLARVSEKQGYPTKTNDLVRAIPDLPKYSHPVLTAALGGILPFATVHGELWRVLSAFWLHQIYYTLGHLLTAFTILTILCAQVAIVLCYWQLNRQDHCWWYKSFWNCASVGVYVFFDAILFLRIVLNLDGAFSVIIYLTHASILSVCFGLYCGAIGVLASLCFNRIIYGTIKKGVN